MIAHLPFLVKLGILLNVAFALYGVIVYRMSR